MNERNWGGARRGAGRKKGDVEYETISLSLPSDEMKILLDAAKRSRLSVARFVSEHLGLATAAEFERKQRAEDSGLPENLTGGERLC